MLLSCCCRGMMETSPSPSHLLTSISQNSAYYSRVPDSANINEGWTQAIRTLRNPQTCLKEVCSNVDQVSQSQKVTLRMAYQVSLAVPGKLSWLIMTDDSRAAALIEMARLDSDWRGSDKGGGDHGDLLQSLRSKRETRETRSQRESCTSSRVCLT